MKENNIIIILLLILPPIFLIFFSIYYIKSTKSKSNYIQIEQNNIPSHIYMSDYDIKNLLHKDIKIIHGNLMSELPEQIMAYKYIDSNDSILELGGNIGTNSIIINSKLNNKNNHVVVETLKDIIHKLEDNRNINNAKFQIFNGAISKKPLIQKGWNTKYIPESGIIPEGWFEIPTFSYDEFLKKVNINFNVIVADCEGCLNSILIDNPSILKQINKIILEHDFPNDNSYFTFIKLMKDNGFKKIAYMEKGDKHCPDINWDYGVKIDKDFVSVWKK